MRKILYILSFIVVEMLSANRLIAQDRTIGYRTVQSDSLRKSIKGYGGLVHQHQNFFKKAFSFQGIETGIVINHTYLIAVYGATFASTLRVERVNSPRFIYIGQYGLLLGIEQDNRKKFHLGALLSTGRFSLIGSNTTFSLNKVDNPLIRLHGFVISPQVYGELAIMKWMKLRSGVGYNVYRFQEQPMVVRSELQNVALTFGFIFGNLH